MGDLGVQYLVFDLSGRIAGGVAKGLGGMAELAALRPRSTSPN